MMTDLSSSFISLAREVGVTVEAVEGGFSAADLGGEIRYGVASTSRGYLLTEAERARDAIEGMLSTSIEDIQRYLVTIFGFDYRASRRLPPILLPYQWDRPAGGFKPLRIDDQWSTLVRSSGERLACELVDRDVIHPVITFSYVADRSIDDVVDSFRAEDGRPFFDCFIDHSARDATSNGREERIGDN